LHFFISLKTFSVREPFVWKSRFQLGAQFFQLGLQIFQLGLPFFQLGTSSGLFMNFPSYLTPSFMIAKPLNRDIMTIKYAK